MMTLSQKLMLFCGLCFLLSAASVSGLLLDGQRTNLVAAKTTTTTTTTAAATSTTVAAAETTTTTTVLTTVTTTTTLAATTTAPTASTTSTTSTSTTTTTTTSTTTTNTIGEVVAVIAKRFEALDAEVDALRTRLAKLSDGVVEVESLANITGTGVNNSETELERILVAAEANAEAAEALKVEFLNASARLNVAEERETTINSAVKALEKSAFQFGSQSSDLGKKIGDLEAVVDEVLPGRDSVSGRIEAANKTLEEYRSEVSNGTLDFLVATRLRANFVRARRRTQDLTDAAMVAQQEEQEEDGEGT